MAYQISDGTRKQTTKCKFSFQCLNEKSRDVCSINYCVNPCFLKTVKTGDCPYKMMFGDSYICNCPTRAELYKRYQI
jgi:hypothetical protein